MGMSLHWSWLVGFSCLLCIGGEVRADCTEDNLGIEQGNNYTLTNGLESGSILVYKCPDDFYAYPVMTRVCQPNGRWKPEPKKSPPQKCRMVQCPDPTVLQYGDVFPPQERYYVHNVTTYECYSGYKMRGSTRRVCLKNGKWSGHTPICSRDSGVHCADPGIPPGATRTGNMFQIDDSVTYTCNGDLFLVGSKERVCQENGYWTGQEPGCYYKHTYDTSLDVSEAFGSAIRESLTILQSTDDTQEGKKIRIPKNGTLLNIYIAMDISESIDTEEITSAREAVSTLLRKISSFSVNPNYEILFFSSKIFEIVNIVDMVNGKVKLESVLKDLDEFTRHDKPSGTNLNIVFKTFLERMHVIKKRVGEEDFKKRQHVIIIFTDGAYNMGGSPLPNLERIKELVYMNQASEADAESREEHLDVYAFGIGSQILDDELQALASQRKDRHFFRLEDHKKLKETIDEIIDEENVIGLCGLHRESKTTDKSSTRKRFPWFVFVIVKTGQKHKRCLGSLVTPQFVLTAAHCVRSDVLPEDITVEINDGQIKGRKVQNYTIHPDYNITSREDLGVAEFYDYDVVLIQLKKDVEISPALRTICIPCTQETSNALKLTGVSTCRQQEEILLKNSLESLSFLTRVQDSVKVKNVHAKLAEKRDECISHALEAEGITTTDVNVVVTDNFLCTGGRSDTVDHISCTGDSGGAVFKHYKQRTIQVAVVSWGTKSVCEEGDVADSHEDSRDFHINLFKIVPFLKSILGDDTQNDYAPLTFLSD